MNKTMLIMLSIALIGISGCKEETKKEEVKTENTEEAVKEEARQNQVTSKSISFKLDSKSGSTATGKAAFSESNGVVTFEAKLVGLTPGTHAIHIHEKADCSSDDGKSTGGHWNPTFAPHGKWGSEEGYHKGDIGNLEANDDGTASISLQTDEWCIGCGDPNKDIMGKAIIVHEGVDDFVTQPTGNAGGRISCGGIIE